MGDIARYKYKDIQLPQLRSFCLVASEGNFTAAAASLSLSVSAVWQQVRALEQKLGVTLVRRRGRAVELTSSGRLLLELAQPHVTGLDSLARLFESRQAGLADPLGVVATPHLLVHHLPDLVQHFVREHRAARINLRAGRWHEILELVERGEADLGLAPLDPGAGHHPTLEFEPLFEQPLLLLTSANHPLRRKKVLRPRDLIDFPFIVQTNDTCDYASLVRLLHKDDATVEQLQVVLVSHTVDMTFRYVARGVGIALVHVDPKTCRSVPGVYSRVFDPHLPKLPFVLVVRKNSYRSHLVQEFCKAVRHSLRES
jgi:DNA-binding transcriptional LysR family regulator